MKFTRFVVALIVLALCASVPVSAGAAPADGDAVAAAKKKKKKKKKKKPVAPKPGGEDGDALPAAWETKPVTTTKKKKKKKKKGKKSAAQAAAAAPELWKLGASPTHKDIFVQLNFAGDAVRQMIPCSELDKVVDAFATAPVTNPDGKPGINLHLDAGKVCPSRSYALGDSRTFDIPGNPPCPSLSELFNYGNSQFSDARVGSFRVAQVGDGCGGTHGAAQAPGSASAVFTGGGDFAHVFMHELGHNLGLQHSFSAPGGNGTEFQPNRFSVMNGRIFKSPDDSAVTEHPDYQRTPTPSLDESNLDEQTGLGVDLTVYGQNHVSWRCPSMTLTNGWLGYGGKIDWDCDSPLGPPPPTFEGAVAPQDVNGDGVIGVVPGVPNEWNGLDYTGGGYVGKLVG